MRRGVMMIREDGEEESDLQAPARDQVRVLSQVDEALGNDHPVPVALLQLAEDHHVLAREGGQAQEVDGAREVHSS